MNQRCATFSINFGDSLSRAVFSMFVIRNSGLQCTRSESVATAVSERRASVFLSVMVVLLPDVIFLFRCPSACDCVDGSRRARTIHAYVCRGRPDSVVSPGACLPHGPLLDDLAHG